MSSTAMVHKPGCAKADVVLLCKCGANLYCRTCGWGRGAIPCACSKAVSLPVKLGEEP